MKIISLVLFLISFNVFAFQAPSFELKGHDNQTHKLSDYKGKWVVLEWFNHGCPFVRKHYDSENMQKLQKKYKDKVVWLTINSSAPNKQGHLASASEAMRRYKDEGMKSQALLLDGTDGIVGKLYNAKTTPHMFIIDPKGETVYQGAIDSIASADKADIPKATNYVAQTLDLALAGKKITSGSKAPYGCSVKY